MRAAVRRLAAVAGPLALVVPMALLGATGCAGAGSTGRAGIVDELAARLDRGSKLPYQARYRLAGGGTATVAHAVKPERLAFVFPSERYLLALDATTTCTAGGQAGGEGAGGAGAWSCLIADPPNDITQPDPAAISRAAGGAYVPATMVLSLLTRAAEDDRASIRGYDATVAGQPVGCVAVSGASATRAPRFTACLTYQGVLARFSGVLDGRTLDVELTSLRATTPDTLFAPPAGARLADHRDPH